MKTKCFAIVICLSSIFCAGIQGQSCHSSVPKGVINGDTLCIPVRESGVWTYRYRYPEEVDTSEVRHSAWSVSGEIEKVSEGFDFIQVKSTGREPGRIQYTYQLESDQNRTCVQNGCVTYTYYAAIDINKIAEIDFAPAIEGSPYVEAGQSAIFGLDNLHGANGVEWEAPESLSIVKYSSYKDYATYRVVSSPQPGDTLRVRMSFTCRGEVTASVALAVRTEKPEIEEPEALDCLAEEQDSVYLSVKSPLAGYVYWWSSMEEDWAVIPLNAQGSKALLRAKGGESGVFVLYATNGYGTDTATNVYKVRRCVERCAYDTLGIDITEASCLRQGDTAIFRIKADPGATTYRWEFGGGWEPSEYVAESPYDTVVKVKVGSRKGWAKVTGINCAGEWIMQTADSIAISLGELKLQHYDGCVNIGKEDTLHLQVENPVAGLRYEWRIPEGWRPIGSDTCGELTVLTLENAATTQIYSVSASICDKLSDTIQVKGADTTLFLRLRQGRYIAVTESGSSATTKTFDFGWYKGSLTEENFVASSSWILESQLEGQEPLLQYRGNGDNTCWTVTSAMYTSTPAMYSASKASPPSQEQHEEKIACQPNPTTNQSLLRWETDVDKIEIISESGQRVRMYNVTGLQQKLIDMTHMQQGVYIVRFLSEKSLVATKKLIKK